jgi:hypothetical protein
MMDWRRLETLDSVGERLISRKYLQCLELTANRGQRPDNSAETHRFGCPYEATAGLMSMADMLPLASYGLLNGHELCSDFTMVIYPQTRISTSYWHLHLPNE